MGQLGTTQCAQHLSGEVADAAQPGRAVAELAGVRPGCGDDILHGHQRRPGADRQDIGRPRDTGQRRKRLLAVVGYFALHVRGDGLRRQARQQDGVIIGRGVGDHRRAHRTCGAAPVLDDHRVRDELRHALRQRAPEDVRYAAGRKRHHEADRPRREAVLRGRRSGRQRGDRGSGRAEESQARHGARWQLAKGVLAGARADHGRSPLGSACCNTHIPYQRSARRTGCSPRRLPTAGVRGTV